MGLGQTLLTIMALMLMGRLILSMSTTTLDVGFTKDMAEYRITATSLGTSMLEQANGLAFDEATVSADISLTSSLTPVASLGKDAGETSPSNFDDFDDYNNYSQIDSLPSSAVYKTSAKVEYVTVSGGAITVSSTQTFSKRITVNVTSDFLIDYSVSPPRPDTLKFQAIYSYWYFR